MKKKVLSIALAGAMALSLAACTSTENGNGGSTGSTGNTTEPTVTATTEDGSLKGTLKLGMIGPLTGGAALYGTAVSNGAKIAVDEINEKYEGFQIEYNPQDDEHDAEKSVNAYNQLKDWNVHAIVGCVTTSPCIAVSAEANSDRVFMLTPSASSTEVTADKNQTFQAKADELGLDVVATSTFMDGQDTDFTVQLTEAQNAGAELVFLPIYYTPASLILAQANTMGYDATFFGVDGMDGILDIEGFDKSLAEGVLLLTPFSADATDDLTVNFVTKYKAAYNETPIQFAADGYDCPYAIVAALEYYAAKNGGLDVDQLSAADLCEILVSVFAADDFSVDGVTGANMTWTANGEVNKAPKAVVIKDGVYVGL